MPQLDIGSFIPQLIWSLFAFFTFYTLVTTSALPSASCAAWTRKLKMFF